MGVVLAGYSIYVRPDLLQVFWDGMQAGDFITDAVAAINTSRRTGRRVLVEAGGVRIRRGCRQQRAMPDARGAPAAGMAGAALGGGIRLRRHRFRSRQVSARYDVWQGGYSLGGAEVFPLIGHAVGNIGTYGNGIGIVTVPGDECPVSSAGHGQGADFFMGGVRLFLEGMPTGSGSCFEGGFAKVVCHGRCFRVRGAESRPSPVKVPWAGG
ncbi:hypothetical protein HGG74_19975 [Arthrobacter sp. E918]|uniref:Uncharacterized protein n=1 Tax=Arthrobacter mobilis TaxID=2724944 RepID=A0A7X6K7T4_9MICC|nr:hypothetical protein [Arthrobacter mobilis]NKX56754.1 hypothetical protein [Arthrobacter mobilis]